MSIGSFAAEICGTLDVVRFKMTITINIQCLGGVLIFSSDFALVTADMCHFLLWD